MLSKSSLARSLAQVRQVVARLRQPLSARTQRSHLRHRNRNQDNQRANDRDVLDCNLELERQANRHCHPSVTLLTCSYSG